MRNLAFLAIAAVLLFAPLSASGNPLEVESHIWTDNASDTGVWVTVYDFWHNIRGAWCVYPKSFDKHGLKVKIYRVRFEIAQRNCGHPVYLDTTEDFRSKSDYAYSHSDEFKVDRSADGRYHAWFVKMWSN